MPQGSDDSISLTLPRFGVKALELYAKTQARELRKLADSPIKGMARKRDARRQEVVEWQAVAALCFEAMAATPVPAATPEA